MLRFASPIPGAGGGMIRGSCVFTDDAVKDVTRLKPQGQRKAAAAPLILMNQYR